MLQNLNTLVLTIWGRTQMLHTHTLGAGKYGIMQNGQSDIITGRVNVGARAINHTNHR